ncbi:MAG: von Willebrand factor type A domain-containing protein [bacterium]|nr:von Willebrand factor type A domain-containing protein [bacterium]
MFHKATTFLLIALIALLMVACSPPASEVTIPANSAQTTQNQPAEAPVLEQEIVADDGLMQRQTSAESLPPNVMAVAPAPTGGAPVGAVPPPNQGNQPVPTPIDMQFEDYGVNPFIDTQDDNLSTFAMDVDTASYTVARNYLIGQSQYPPDEAIRIEEFVNYFDAGYESPSDETFGIYLDAAPAPFGYDGHYVLRVGIQGKYISPEDRQPTLLIFVIDVSGSMDMENRLGLVKETLALLVNELREDDRVAIAVYSDNSRVVLQPTPASEKDTLLTAINNLQSEGSTNAEAGLNLGYQVARENLREGENTRVILLSDGVANVGNTGPDAILNTIKEGVEAGITMSAIGFGMGNYNDVLMEQLANDGNGNYYYVDNIREARRVFVHNLTSTLQVIGYDAKIQVDFNPEITDRYRLLGYENRAVADEDFRNDTVDAGEVGAGHSVTALYELALQEGDNLEGVIATAYIRYEDAETREVVELQRAITVADVLASFDEAPANFKVQVAVAEFAELLKGSFWAEDGTYGAVLALIESADMGENEDVAELIEMIRVAVRLSDQ